MKVSCLPVSLFPALSGGQMPLADWCGAAKECGLDGIDISMSFLSSHAPAYLDGVKDALEKAGAQVVMATAYPDFTHPQKRQREREMAYFVRDIALCSELSIPYLRVLAGQAHPETAVRDGVRWAIENIRNASNAADHYGVQLLYEDHSKPGAWKYADFSYPPDIFLEIADGIWDTSAIRGSPRRFRNRWGCRTACAWMRRGCCGWPFGAAMRFPAGTPPRASFWGRLRCRR
jgi:sugar phosphate isomerase/epimerase